MNERCFTFNVIPSKELMTEQKKYHSYREAWKQRIDRERNTWSRRKEKAKMHAKNCAKYLYESHNVSHVYLIGSLVKDREFDRFSDIDMVVKGLPPDQYFQVLSTLHNRLPAWLSLDLIPYESASPELRGKIYDEGVQL